MSPASSSDTASFSPSASRINTTVAEVTPCEAVVDPRRRIRDLNLYATEAMFYLVGRDARNQMWRVLKIDRSEPTSLKLVEDSTCYTDIQRDDLLKRIHAENKTTGGLKRIKCCAIVGFIKFHGPYYMLLITKSRKIGTILGHDIYSVQKSKIIPIPAPHVLPSEAKSDVEKSYLKQLHSVDLSKEFFYSFSYNLEQTLQKNQNDTTFVWNEFLTEGIWEHINNAIWTVALVHGFFGQETLSVSEKKFLLTIIARRSRHFAGPRFFKRGVNEDGDVANDVEIEQIVFEKTQDEIPSQITSVVQRRGSIPLLWSQETTRYPIKPEISLKSDKDDYKATRLHFKNLQAGFADPIIVLNLLKTVDKKPNELLLRREYAKVIDHINKDLPKGKHILFVHMDMNHNSLRNDVLPYLLSVGLASSRKTGIFHCKVTPNSASEDTSCEQGDSSTSRENDNLMYLFLGAAEAAVGRMCVTPQKGVLRTNCLDCLDRTNVAQFAYGLAALGSQLDALGICGYEISVDDPLFHKLMDLYGQMGDKLSIQYAGSAAQNKVFWEQSGQCAIAIMLKKNIRSFCRFVSNAFMDSKRQRALDVFLGLSRPQQGEPPGSANICNRQENPGNEDESGLQGTQVIEEEQNCSIESKYEYFIYSNFLKPDEVLNAGKFREAAPEG